MSKESLNILITAASRRVALIRAFQKALQDLDLNGSVVSTDINLLSPGLYVSDQHHWAPLTTDPDYLKHLLSICEQEQIKAIVPTIDDELVLMGEARESFAERGINIIISPPRTSRICNDKWETYQFFLSQGVPTPETWTPDNLPPLEELRYPLFLKPRCGRGSVNTYTLRNRKELEFFLSYVQDPIVQYFLEGDEYTLDTFRDEGGRVISVVPRRRLWVRSGVMDKGRTENDRGLIKLGADVANKLDVVGAVNIQVKFAEGEPYVFEVNPRFSGGIPLTIAAGADFPRWTLEMVLGRSLQPRLGKFADGLVMMSYEENIFRRLDIDDFGTIDKLIT